MGSVSSGITHVDRFLGGFQPGDNVVWSSEAGTAIHSFVQAFIRSARSDGRGAVVYVNCNYAPQSIYRRFAEGCVGVQFVHVDAFTYGKGKRDAVFREYYESPRFPEGYETVCMKNPTDTGELYETLACIEDRYQGEAHYVFDSLTGLCELWGDERPVQDFFSNQCPKLYELQAVAYWILEKQAHSRTFLATLSHITQVVIQLNHLESGLCELKLSKAEDRPSRLLYQAMRYRVEQDTIDFVEPMKERPLPIGDRIREQRIARNLSQAELARMLAITPSALCQIENNQVYPSLPLLIEIARSLGQSLDGLLNIQEQDGVVGGTLVVCRKKDQLVYRHGKGQKAPRIEIVPLLPMDAARRSLVPYRISAEAGTRVQRPFLNHKGPEFGLVLSGMVRLMTLGGKVLVLRKGDSFYLEEHRIKEWRNEGPAKAELLWILVQ